MEGFTPLEIRLDGDGAFADLADQEVQSGRIESVAVLAGGTHRGKPSIALKIKCEDTTYVVAETTWNLFASAARAIEARYGPPS